MPTIPDRASNAGPDTIEALDWRDYLWVADENTQAARRMEIDDCCYDAPGAKRNASRIAAIQSAIDALEAAKELLCQ